MSTKNKTLVISILLILVIILFPGCTENNGGNEEDKKYFSETYSNIPFILKIELETSNDSSYIIIPVPIQNNKTLEISSFQNHSDFNNYSYEFIDTEHGKGLRITPIPTGEFWLWFACESYTVKGPFDIKQTDQFYNSEFPGLSTWNTDGNFGYYWFYSSINLTKFSYRYEYSDCYCFSDKGELENVLGQEWLKMKNNRVQIDMEM
jgi:hypothetical protein